VQLETRTMDQQQKISKLYGVLESMEVRVQADLACNHRPLRSTPTSSSTCRAPSAEEEGSKAFMDLLQGMESLVCTHPCSSTVSLIAQAFLLTLVEEWAGTYLQTTDSFSKDSRTLNYAVCVLSLTKHSYSSTPISFAGHWCMHWSSQVSRMPLA
jgi:hypothetical protein